jgi:hypothetical protein
MITADPNEKFSRQVILPGVGTEGQKKWNDARVLLAGEGIALLAASQALSSVGISKISLLIHKDFDPSFLVSSPPQINVEAIPFSNKLPTFTMALVVSQNAHLRRKLNRMFRKNHQPAVFAWPSGSGFALFTSRYVKDAPCLECFEVLNPKAFSKGSASVERLLGATASSEALEFILNGESPLENKVWITALESGLSTQHEVLPTYKCPAKMIESGAAVTP